MTAAQLRSLKKQFEELLVFEGTKTAREKLVVSICDLYEILGKQATSDDSNEVYDLFVLSTHIFKAANKEVVDNDAKWLKERGKENKSGGKVKTKLFELSIYHLKNCCQTQLDHNNVPWIQYCLTVLRKPWIQSEVSMESELSMCLLSCSTASELHWAQHQHVKQLWNFAWSRIADRKLDMSILKNYVELAVKIVKNVELTVYETTPFHVVKMVVMTLKRVAQQADLKFWTHSRKYSFVFILSYTVNKWGIEARDLILREIFEIIDNLKSLISVEDSGIGGDSKSYMMKLTDDLIKLATIDTVGTHRTISEKTEENVKLLLRHAISETLKMAHGLFFSKLRYSIPENYVRCIARWIIALRQLDPPPDSLPSPPHSPSSEEIKKEKKKSNTSTYSFEDLARLSFGETITPNANKCNAWNGAVQILVEVIASRKLDNSVVGNIVLALWTKRKSFSSDALRSAFCSLLAVSVAQYKSDRNSVQFGVKQVPSIDLILKYALSLMSNVTSLANSAHLVECILRFRPAEVPNEMIRAICDTVSRTSPSSIPVLRLISALISNTEFDESARFCSISDDENGNWSLRKDIVNWLLADPSAASHKLIYQLCRYHPKFCYDDDEHPITWILVEEDGRSEDALLESLERCHLLNSPSTSAQSKNFQPLDASIEEIVTFVHGELQFLFENELTLPVFVLCYEFSLKYTELLFNFPNGHQNIQRIAEELDHSEYLQSIQHFTSWPNKLNLPGSTSQEFHMVYLITNLDNQMVDLDPRIYQNQSIIDCISRRVRSNPGIRAKFQQAMPFNNMVKNFILDNPGDLYQTVKRFVTYSFLLSHRNMVMTRTKILKEANEQLESAESIYESDMILFETVTTSACLRNVTSTRIGGYDLDPYAVAFHPENVFFDDRSLIKSLRLLRKSPFLAQNIIRHVLENESLWHLHAKLVNFVTKEEKLLIACVATIPNMIRYLRVYQVHVHLGSKIGQIVKFLNLDSKSIRRCQKYMRKPKSFAEKIDVNDLILLFGTESNKWRRVIFTFWRLFQTNPPLVCEKIHRFASECVELHLCNRTATLLKALTTSEFMKKALFDRNLQTAFELTYRSIFSVIVDKSCDSTIVELCVDPNLRYDLFEHQIKTIPAAHADDFMRFETDMAFSVEKFLKNGIESDDVNFSDFGLVEFYKQLNENLTEEIIKANEAREVYMIDFFASIWLLLPSMRSQILPIVARFKHISPAWAQFPQPPHVAVNENTFLFHLRFNLAMKIIANSKFKVGELSTCAMLLLTTFDSRHYKSDLIPERNLIRLKNETRRNVLCVLTRILRNETKKDAKEVMNEEVFEAVTRAASLFPHIAACVIPFFFKICVDVKNEYDFAVGKFLESLKGVDKNDRAVVLCLAECVDSMGLNVLARYERLCDDPKSPQFATQFFFLLARIFIQHGFLTHAFSIANLIFDRLSSTQRNVMMIDRISMENLPKSEQIIELLVDIYVAENNSVALSSLPPRVQTRSDVRKVMRKKAKEWLRLVSTDQLGARESTVIHWLCGLRSEDVRDRFLDSVLRCRFTDYPKLIDSPSKFVYFLLFHSASMNTDVIFGKSEILSRMLVESNLSIGEIRLLNLASDDAQFEPESIEEHIIRAVRHLRDTCNHRCRRDLQYVTSVNEKTLEMVAVARILAEHKAHDAASTLLSKWREECVAWSSISTSVDVALVEVCQCDIMCLSGDTRMAEIQLRSMNLGVMSDVATAEWTLVLSRMTLEFRNDLAGGIRLLEKGCKRLQKRDSVEARLKILLKFHSVCMHQLSKLEEYRESRSFRMKKEAISVFEHQINTSRSSKGGSSGESGESKRTMYRVKREQQCEKDEVEKVQNGVVTAAQKAVCSAFDALECISQLDDDKEAIRTASLIVFPLIDVIYKYEQSPEVVALLKDYAQHKLTSKLWLCATSHIASKTFSVEASPIQRYLYQMLCRMIYDYPYHVLHTVLMYEYEKNGSKARSFLNSLFDKNAQRDMAKLKEIFANMREAHAAYRELAQIDTKDNIRLQRVLIDGKTMYRMPADLQIFRCKLRQLPIPTITQKIGLPGNYSTDGLITWKSWKDVFSIADGLSAPKVWEIQGSDGKWYKTVWKKDDVRQDVLVEQMFDVTNNMLEKRMLRTYNVVPLDTECGIIEFCGGTVSIKEMLCGVSRDSGLHQEFNVNEPSAGKVSMMMKSVQTESTESRRKVFVDICKNYSPVFRHFFYTNFPAAHIWRQKLIDYRKSLATWSVVCYIVGLGDRHASNILFDQKLCTFVHIDLGMILEYSKRTLPVPEQVPFRISRDLLDPILIEGIENGQLADDCTATIEKLKQNGKVILGVASALLRETMTNFKETEQASGRPSYISEMAIGRLRDKLEGTDDGVTAQSSNLQVRRLLREATNADNLSRMFCGWMPFL
uniref:non-specific serine/threonine protein kinase n=1 Tax=Caenorhabditis japonica TaxID=281687 RepID=A0A8R1HVQ4_CAEJA